VKECRGREKELLGRDSEPPPAGGLRNAIS